MVVIKWEPADLFRDGVTSANLVFGALLSAYIGVTLKDIPADLRFDQLVAWFVMMFWFVFALHLTLFAVWNEAYKVSIGTLFLVLFAAQYVVRSAGQMGLDWEIFAAVLLAWVLSLAVLTFVFYRVLKRVARGQ